MLLGTVRKHVEEIFVDLTKYIDLWSWLLYYKFNNVYVFLKNVHCICLDECDKIYTVSTV